MPPLIGYQNICDFIACTGYGMLIGAIKDDSGSKLLYAAQVALATVPAQAKTQRRPGPELAIQSTSAPACIPLETPPPPQFPRNRRQRRELGANHRKSPHPNKELT